MENQIRFLQDSFLFSSMKRSESIALIDGLKYSVRSFSKDEVVFSPDKYERMLGLVMSGACSVYKHHQGDQELLMNTLCQGDSFGVLAVFSSSDEYPTLIKANKKTDILFIAADECKRLISQSPEVAEAVISFLSSRIVFLNTKISVLSGKSISEKLAIYLTCEAYRLKSEVIPFNLQKVSDTLSVARQTVYRGIEALASLGLIDYEIKKIIIKDRKGLERLTK